MAIIIGGPGNETLFGTIDPDLIDAAAGDDFAFGDEGGDLILGRAGNDFLDGNDDDDTVFGGAGNDTLAGGQGDDILAGESGGDVLNGDVGNDALDGGAGEDNVIGGSGDDVIVMLVGAGDTDAISAGPGIDTLVLVGSAREILIDFLETSTDQIGVICRGPSCGLLDIDALIQGGLENLDASLFQGFVNFDGGNGPNLVIGSNDPLGDHLDGNPGNDTLIGGQANDTIIGGDGNDVLVGGPGTDTVDGESDDDTIKILVTPGDVDTASGGPGVDMLGLLGSVPGDGVVVIDLSSASDQIRTIGGSPEPLVQRQFENVDASGLGSSLAAIGNGKANLIIGSKGDDVIDGRGGRDTIIGGGGQDVLNGNGGDDAISGGQDDDRIDVSKGDDVVRYETKNDGHDDIFKFDGNPKGGQDALDLDRLLDSLKVATADRLGRVAILDDDKAGPGPIWEVQVDTDGVDGFDLSVASIHSMDLITVGSDILLGTL